LNLVVQFRLLFGAVFLRSGPGRLPGDSLVLTLDSAAHAMKKIDVDTWLAAPTDKVTLAVQMQSLSDGTSYPGTVVLAIPGSHLQVQITNSNYQKIAN